MNKDILNKTGRYTFIEKTEVGDDVHTNLTYLEMLQYMAEHYDSDGYLDMYMYDDKKLNYIELQTNFNFDQWTLKHCIILQQGEDTNVLNTKDVLRHLCALVFTYNDEIKEYLTNEDYQEIYNFLNKL